MKTNIKKILIITIIALLVLGVVTVNAESGASNEGLIDISLNGSTRQQTDAQKYPITEVVPRVNVKQTNIIDYIDDVPRIIENIENQLRDKYGITARSIVVERFNPAGETTITYHDGSKIVLPPEKTIELGTYAYRSTILGKWKNVLYGDVINAEDMTLVLVTGEQGPPAGTTYRFKKPNNMITTNIPNVDHVVQKHSDVIVTFPDGSEKDNYPTRPAIIEIYRYKLAYELEGQDITVIGLGNKPNPRDGVNISSDVEEFLADERFDTFSYRFESPVDTNTTGSKPAKVKVFYPDGTSDSVELTVHVISHADHYIPETINLTVGIGETPKAIDAITNFTQLPEGTIAKFENLVDTSTPGDKNATIIVTYPDGSEDTENIIVTVNSDEPESKDIVVKVGEMPNPADGIANKDKLPVGTTYAFENEPDTTVSGEQTVNIVVTYPGGESVAVPTSLKVVEGDTEADNYEPTGQGITVVGLGNKPSAEDGIANKEALPEGTTYTFEKLIDTSTSGEKDAVIVVTYSDGSIDKVNITVDVKSLADEHNPQGQEIAANYGATIDPRDGISNKDTLPEGTIYRFKNFVDTSVSGERNETIEVVYPDGSSEEVSISVNISSLLEDDEIKLPDEKVKVDNLNNLTDKEKRDVVLALTQANDSSPFDLVINQDNVDSDGTTTVIYADGTTETIPGYNLVTLSDKGRYNPRGGKIKILVNEELNLEEGVINLDELPEGTIIMSAVGKIDTSRTWPNLQVPTFAIYPDGTLSDNFIVNVTIADNIANLYLPTGENIVIKQGTPNSSINPEHGISNKSELPDNVSYSFEDLNIDHSDNMLGKAQSAKIIVTYSDESTDEVDITITVTAEPLNTLYDPEGKDIEVEQGETVKPKDGIANIDELPESAEFTFKEAVDTSTTGKKSTTIIIKYSDDTEDEVNINVIVKSSLEDFELKLPQEKVVVADKTSLTTAEKNSVEEALVEVNPDMPMGTDILILDDGTANILYSNGNRVSISGDQLVEQAVVTRDADKFPIEPLEPKIQVSDSSNLTPEEKDAVKNKVKEQLPDEEYLEETTIDVNNDGSVTVTYPDGSENTLPGTDTVVKKEDPISTEYDDAKFASITIETQPAKLVYIEGGTFDPTGMVVILTDTEGNTKEVNASELGDNGITLSPDASTPLTEAKNNGKPVTVTKGDQSVTTNNLTVNKDETEEPKEDKDKYPLSPFEEKVEVNDTSNLTDEEKEAVKNKVKDQLPEEADVKDTDIVVDDDGSVTVTYPDGSKNTLPGSDTVKSKTPDTEVDKDGLKKAIDDGQNVQETDNYDKAKPEDRKALDDAIAEGQEIYDDPDATQEEVNAARQRILDAIKKINDTTKPTEDTDTDDKTDYDPYVYPDWLAFGLARPGDSEEEQKQEVQPVPGGLNIAYMEGYPDGTIRPNGAVTRAESAAMISRLLQLDISDNSETDYSDTPLRWYNKYINAVTKDNVMEGYPDGTFKPNELITRAEFTQMIANFDMNNSGGDRFIDVSGHWPENGIDQSSANDRIEGYPDGSFRPDGQITRAEAATILNRTFGRDDNKVPPGDIQALDLYSDLQSDHWAYGALLEATRGVLYDDVN